MKTESFTEVVAIFVYESLCYTKQNDLWINCEAIESLSFEISNNDVKNIIFNIVYHPADGETAFQNSSSVFTGLSDFHKLVLTVFKMTFAMNVLRNI